MSWALIQLMVRVVFRALFRVEVRGAVEPGEKTLIVANHQSFIDGMLVGAFLPLRPTYLVHTSVAARWYFRWPLKLIPHLVTDTTSPMAMKRVIGLLESGAIVVMFPEGRLTVTGSRMKLYEGPAFVAAKTGARIICVNIDGPVYSYFSRMRGDFPKKFFPKFVITVMPAQMLPMPDAPRGRERRRLASEEMRRMFEAAELATRKDTTIFDAFLNAIKLHGRGRKMAEDIRGKNETYGQILKMSLALGRLASKYTVEGERVGVLMPTATPTAAMILGLMAMRRVPAMLNYTSGRAGIENACRIAEVHTIFTSRVFVERAKLESLLDRFTEARVVYLEDLRARFGILDKLWLMAFALWFPRAARRAAQPDEMAVVLFTSGSEGMPKGVALSHRSILANCAQVRAVIEMSNRDRFLSALPLFHSFGLTVGTILPLVTGARIYFYPSPLHYRIVPEVFYDRNCTILFATNTFLANYAKFAHPYDFFQLHYVVCGAEKLSEEVRRTYMDKFGVRVLEGYGATECSPVISANTPVSCQEGTVGEPLPGIECRVVPVEGLPSGGVLHVRGPNVMMGYFLAAEPGHLQPPRSELGAGWYETGDIVSIENHRITILGRQRRFAKVAGEMVSLETAERIAAAASPTRQHAAIIWKEQIRGEAVVLVTEDGELRRENLIAAARRLGLPELAVARRLIFREKLPLLGNGKKDYVTLTKAIAGTMEGAAKR